MHVKIKISWTKLMIIEIVLYFFFQAPSSYYVGILIFLNVQNESCSHQIIFIENEKISQKILFVTVCVHTHLVRKWSEKWKFQNFFLLFWTTIFLTITTQNFVKIGEKIFLAAQWSKNGQKKSENFFSLILTKFGMVIVKNMVIQNI